MPFSLIPRGVYSSVLALAPQALADKGVKLVLADLDNTLGPYKVPDPAPDILAWNAALRDAGITLFLLSNSRKKGRVEHFSAALGIPYQGRSGKPRRAGYLRAMERMGVTPAQTVMVGDQIFTDILGANNAGVVPLLVEPVRLAGNPCRYIRYAIEAPFRALGRGRAFL